MSFLPTRRPRKVGYFTSNSSIAKEDKLPIGKEELRRDR
ncbi:hypothetical protein Vi05172_g13304 [Venturia inaequalis]|nr:hypothetical protein Vi05172_g13304 [Venturia inaequalis]